MKKESFKLSAISTLHFAKLIGRSALFLCATVLYIISRINGNEFAFGGYKGCLGFSHSYGSFTP